MNENEKPSLFKIARNNIIPTQERSKNSYNLLCKSRQIEKMSKTANLYKKEIGKITKNFFNETTIHGLGHLIDDSDSDSERHRLGSFVTDSSKDQRIVTTKLTVAGSKENLQSRANTDGGKYYHLNRISEDQVFRSTGSYSQNSDNSDSNQSNFYQKKLPNSQPQNLDLELDHSSYHLNNCGYSLTLPKNFNIHSNYDTKKCPPKDPEEQVKYIPKQKLIKFRNKARKVYWSLVIILAVAILFHVVSLRVVSFYKTKRQLTFSESVDLHPNGYDNGLDLPNLLICHDGLSTGFLIEEAIFWLENEKTRLLNTEMETILIQILTMKLIPLDKQVLDALKNTMKSDQTIYQVIKNKNLLMQPDNLIKQAITSYFWNNVLKSHEKDLQIDSPIIKLIRDKYLSENEQTIKVKIPLIKNKPTFAISLEFEKIPLKPNEFHQIRFQKSAFVTDYQKFRDSARSKLNVKNRLSSNFLIDHDFKDYPAPSIDFNEMVPKSVDQPVFSPSPKTKNIKRTETNQIGHNLTIKFRSQKFMLFLKKISINTEKLNAKMLEDQKTDCLEELIEMAYSISLTKAYQKFGKFLDFEEFLSKITEFSKDLSLFRYVYKPRDVLANHAKEHMRRKIFEEEISRTLNCKINEEEKAADEDSDNFAPGIDTFTGNESGQHNNKIMIDLQTNEREKDEVIEFSNNSHQRGRNFIHPLNIDFPIFETEFHLEHYKLEKLGSEANVFGYFSSDQKLNLLFGNNFSNPKIFGWNNNNLAILSLSISGLQIDSLENYSNFIEVSNFFNYNQFCSEINLKSAATRQLIPGVDNGIKITFKLPKKFQLSNLKSEHFPFVALYPTIRYYKEKRMNDWLQITEIREKLDDLMKYPDLNLKSGIDDIETIIARTFDQESDLKAEKGSGQNIRNLTRHLQNSVNFYVYDRTRPNPIRYQSNDSPSNLLKFRLDENMSYRVEIQSRQTKLIHDIYDREKKCSDESQSSSECIHKKYTEVLECDPLSEITTCSMNFLPSTSNSTVSKMTLNSKSINQSQQIEIFKSCQFSTCQQIDIDLERFEILPLNQTWWNKNCHQSQPNNKGGVLKNNDGKIFIQPPNGVKIENLIQILEENDYIGNSRHDCLFMGDNVNLFGTSNSFVNFF